MVKTCQYYSDIKTEWEEEKAPWIKLYNLTHEYNEQWEYLHKDIILCPTNKKFDTFEEATDFVKNSEYALAGSISEWLVDGQYTGQYTISFIQ